MCLTDIRNVVFAILFCFFSCSDSTQIIELEYMVKDTVKVDEKVLAKVYSNNSDWKIAKAYFDCDQNNGLGKINKIDESIYGCRKELFIRDDTVLIQFTPTKLGYFNFGKITALLKNGQNGFQVLETDFSYLVVKGSE